MQEYFAGLTLDEALRRLLHEFKLPGEAQQIDRIMEKFAEAFCRSNGGVFRAAEDAYRLAFATIMLNTDVHNPLADHMLSFETFVEMNSDAQDDGTSLPVLPEEELQGIFDRIVEKVCRGCVYSRAPYSCAAAALDQEAAQAQR
jgi:brefeldin A-inhibited guanine nucleotide-exchange protein